LTLLGLHFSDSFLDSSGDPVSRVPKDDKASRIKWDKADLASYYYCATDVGYNLSQIDPSQVFTNCEQGACVNMVMTLTLYTV